MSPKVLFALVFVIIASALVTAIVLIAPHRPPPPGVQGFPHPVFEVLSTRDLCQRLTSTHAMTRENALIAMKSYDVSMPEDAADALCLAVVLERIEFIDREPELIDFHLVRHRTVIRQRATRMLEAIRDNSVVIGCDGRHHSPTRDGILALERLNEM